MIKQMECGHLPHAATAAQMQAVNILRLLRPHDPPGFAPSPEPKPVCRQFDRYEGCPYLAYGFLNWGSEDDCLRTRMKKLNGEEAVHEDQCGPV